MPGTADIDKDDPADNDHTSEHLKNRKPLTSKGDGQQRRKNDLCHHGW